MSVFLKKGLSPNVVNKYNVNPLAISIQSCNENTFYTLLDASKISKQTFDIFGNNALHYLASASCSNLFAKSLFDYNEKLVNARNDLGFTPLYVAVASNNASFAKFLLERGAIVSAHKDSHNNSLQELALQNGNDELRSFIQKHVANSYPVYHGLKPTVSCLYHDSAKDIDQSRAYENAIKTRQEELLKITGDVSEVLV
jgi:ankyrin repeat protein